MNPVFIWRTVEGVCPHLCCCLRSLWSLWSLQKYTLRVECSLPKSQFDFVDPEVSFTANVSFKHYTFRFEPKVSLL